LNVAFNEAVGSDDVGLCIEDDGITSVADRSNLA